MNNSTTIETFLDGLRQPWLQLFPGDHSRSTMPRQTPGKLFSLAPTQDFPQAHLLHHNQQLAADLGMPDNLTPDFVNLLNARVPEEISTYATAYSGHQFGHWAGQLGDGRAILLGEFPTQNQMRYEWQWKGAGATAYARRADGRAVLRSTIREYLMSEAMHHLGVPTSRALSISLTGEKVVRDIMYDGNAAYEKGAMMVRLAESFLRFGHYEFLAAQQESDWLKKLLDFTIQTYFPSIDSQAGGKYVLWFEEVTNRTMQLMIDWQRVGFVHGVMNTDNMSALGLSIDYGPYSMLDDYNLEFTPNTTDLPGRRYKFGAQPAIALWNLNRLANAIALVEKDHSALESILNAYNDKFWQAFDAMMLRKLGLSGKLPEQREWPQRVQKFMIQMQLDYNLFFVSLETWEPGKNVQKHFSNSTYRSYSAEEWEVFNQFLLDYQQALQSDIWTAEEAKKSMQKTNPKFILRNYQLHTCAQQAEQGNYTPFHDLYQALQQPYNITQVGDKYNQKRPDWANDLVGATQLSCSS